MIDPIRSKAALWAGAGFLAIAGVATSFAAAGTNSNEIPVESEPAIGLISAVQPQLEPESFEALAEPPLEPEANEPEVGDGTSEEALVLGVPQDSPACENNGCGEVTNSGGVTLHLPQPAVDGINRAAENRAAAQGNGIDEDDDPVEATNDAEDSSEDAVRGVPADSPACEKHGCEEVETPGGVTVNVPQPAADGMAKARANREAAQGKGSGDDGSEPDDTQQLNASGGNGNGKPDGAGPPAGKGKNR